MNIIFVVYSHYKNTKCNGRGAFQRQRYESLSEAKSACNIQSSCEMVEEYTSACEEWSEWRGKGGKRDVRCGVYYRTCSGGIYHPIRSLAEDGTLSLSEVWLKGYHLIMML